MSSSSIIVRYDGPALVSHQMDVADLAPALLGLSELCKIANKTFNGERAAIKVLIGTDQEHKCFQFSLDIVQSLWSQAAALIAGDEVKSAKEILEWLGLLVAPAGGAIFGLFKLLKWLNGRKITEARMEVKDGKNVAVIRVDGNNNNVVVAHPQAWELLNNPAAVANAKKVIEPLAKPGYEKIEFESGQVVTESITKDDAEEIIAIEPPSEPEKELGDPQTITAWVKVYAPVYDLDASQWRFQLGDHHERMDISETDIAQRAIERGGVLIDDMYKVSLEIRQTQTPSGQIRVKYKINQVMEFIPAKRIDQGRLFGDEQN